MSDKLEHLRMIEARISALEVQSFAVKALSIAVSAGLVGVATAKMHPGIASICMATGMIIVGVLWYTDAHYHQVKSAYRELFNAVRTGAENAFQMDPAGFMSSLRPHLWQGPTAWLYGGIWASLGLLTLGLKVT